MTRILLTGASGYVGGTVLSAIVHAYPESQITCLVRDQSKASIIQDAFDVSIVNGDLDQSDLLKTSAQNSDIVLHLAATGHISSTKALMEGLSNRTEDSKGYFIQLTGATLLSQREIKNGTYGMPSDEVYDDLEHVEQAKELVKAFPNRTVDNFVLFECPRNVKTALVVGPVIYGQGAGPVNQRSIQVPEIARVTIQRGFGFLAGEGQNAWANVHVADLGDLFVQLVRAAVDEGTTRAAWNQEGLYFAENGEMSFGSICEAVTTSAYRQNLLASPKIEQKLDTKSLDALVPHGSILLGTNARCKAQRAREILDWSSSGASLLHEMDSIVSAEAARLGQ